ncbi:MAG: hypothetical protein KJO34_16840 [Deltaproteobacteria bacterium]|nr:hypothetical protein [Deltaproteobacteria bacterium]
MYCDKNDVLEIGGTELKNFSFNLLFSVNNTFKNPIDRLMPQANPGTE